MILFLCCCVLAAILAEDATVTYHRVKNSSLCLPAAELSKNSDQPGTWLIGKMSLVSGTRVNPDFDKKIEYHRGNQTLCLKNLAESAVYTFRVEVNFEHLEEHRSVVVEDPVPRPTLAVAPLGSNQSCILSVNCSVWDVRLQSVCTPRGCGAPPGGPAPASASALVNLSVSLQHGAVVCSGSNNVSTNSSSWSMEATCGHVPDVGSAGAPRRDWTTLLATVVPLCLCAVLAMAAGLLVRVHKRRRARLVTPQSIQSLPFVAAAPRPSAGVSPSASFASSEAAYENVEAAPTQTVYAAAFPAGGKAEARGGGEADAADAATCRPADTLYCVLQKPKDLETQRHLGVTGESGQGQ